MSIDNSVSDLSRDLIDQAESIGLLAKDEKAFESAYAAFRSGDPKAYQTALNRLRLLPRCHLICRWIRIKECVFLCLKLCGPPKPITRAVNPRELAEAIARITSDQRAVSELVEAVEKVDAALFERIVTDYKLERLCHLFCHWICVLRYRLLCRLMCAPVSPERPKLDLAGEMRAAGQALRQLLERRGAFDKAVIAWNEGDADTLGAVIRDAGLVGFCHFICEWFCSLRCALVCLTFCREFPLPAIEHELQEARAFGSAVARLAKNPADLERLSAAVISSDAKAYSAIVKELKLQRFCIQLCQWICAERCRLFCIRVCPPVDTIPLFTHVGQYHVDPIWGDFQPDGTTTAGRYAFTRTIPLRGLIPDGTAGDAYEYHFRVAKYTSLGPPTLGPTQDVDASMIPPTVIGQLEFWYWNVVSSAWLVGSADYWVNQPNPAFQVVSIPQQLGPPLVVTVNKNVKAGGWIEVPRENNLVIGGIGRFVPTGALANLDTTKLTTEPFDLRTPAPGLHAGDTVPAAKESTKPVFKVFFEARKVIGGASVSSNDRDRIALSNTAYTYTRHAEWAGGDVTNRSVCSLDVGELVAPGASGCDRLHGHVHALYTGYHPYLQGVSLWFEGNAIPATLPTAGLPFQPLAPGADETVSPAGGNDFDISGLAPCAYILWMSTTVGLTEGWGLIGDATEWDHIAFCVR